VWRKNVMTSKIVGFYNLTFFLLIIFSELTTKCVIRFGRFVGILKNHWKWEKGIMIFNMYQNMIVCRPKVLFWKLVGLLDLVIWICFLSYLEWINSSMCNNYLQTGFLHISLALCYLMCLSISSDIQLWFFTYICSFPLNSNTNVNMLNHVLLY
jgi:hypothetical protein